MKYWLAENWFKLAGIAVILIIGLSYINYLNTKEYNQKRVDEQKSLELKEVENKKYLAGRKSDCLKIYSTEGEKWSNVRGWRFDDDEDACYIRYKEDNPKTEAECDKNYKEDNGTVIPILIPNYLMCKDGEFENSF